jgi:hypothetical protein
MEVYLSVVVMIEFGPATVSIDTGGLSACSPRKI